MLLQSYILNETFILQSCANYFLLKDCQLSNINLRKGHIFKN